jgi:hypothetical protein
MAPWPRSSAALPCNAIGLAFFAWFEWFVDYQSRLAFPTHPSSWPSPRGRRNSSSASFCIFCGQIRIWLRLVLSVLIREIRGQMPCSRASRRRRDFFGKKALTLPSPRGRGKSISRPGFSPDGERCSPLPLGKGWVRVRFNHHSFPPALILAFSQREKEWANLDAVAAGFIRVDT